MDSSSDRATAAFIRRTLCAPATQSGLVKDRAKPRPIEELLPPLTSSNEVDVQLYALIAIIIRDYVEPWYDRVSSDRAFIDELIRIVAHATRALEQRLRRVDLEALLLDEVPARINEHRSGTEGGHPMNRRVRFDEDHEANEEATGRRQRIERVTVDRGIRRSIHDSAIMSLTHIRRCHRSQTHRIRRR